MRTKTFALLLAFSICIVVPGQIQANEGAQLSQRNIEFSAAQKQKPHPRKPNPPAAPFHYRGFADPSFGPDGKPYKVPEYLRNQCYIDEGYGRFTACNYRN
jgi:hypothetical protein